MKPSGIEWIGDIPDDWEVRRLKAISKLQTGNTPSTNNKNNYAETGFPWLKPDDLCGTIKESQAKVFLSPAGKLETRILPANSILLCCIGSIGKIGFVSTECASNQQITALIIKHGFWRYFLYVLRIAEEELMSLSVGNVVFILNSERLGSLKIPFPPLKTQQKIADYLDEKCGEIDATISKQKESIEKLKAYKQSLISETVTKGFDKSAPLKPSGIKWLGEIPQNARIIRLRFLSSIQTGDKDTVNRVENGKYPFYVRSPIVERIDTFSFDGEAILMAGDGVGAGKVFHYVNGKFDYHQRVYNIHNLKGVLGKFLYYYLRENFYKEIEQSNAKSTVDSIRLPMLLDFPIIVYPYDLQKEMVSFLDKKVAEIDAIIIKNKI